jgi:hypothetical protein
MSPSNKMKLSEEKVVLSTIVLPEKLRQGRNSLLNSSCYLVLDLVRTEQSCTTDTFLFVSALVGQVSNMRSLSTLERPSG